MQPPPGTTTTFLLSAVPSCHGDPATRLLFFFCFFFCFFFFFFFFFYFYFFFFFFFFFFFVFFFFFFYVVVLSDIGVQAVRNQQTSNTRVYTLRLPLSLCFSSCNYASPVETGRPRIACAIDLMATGRTENGISFRLVCIGTILYLPAVPSIYRLLVASKRRDTEKQRSHWILVVAFQRSRVASTFRRYRSIFPAKKHEQGLPSFSLIHDTR